MISDNREGQGDDLEKLTCKGENGWPLKFARMSPRILIFRQETWLKS